MAIKKIIKLNWRKRQHCHCEWKLEKKETIEEELDAAAQWQTHQEDKD